MTLKVKLHNMSHESIEATEDTLMALPGNNYFERDEDEQVICDSDGYVTVHCDSPGFLAYACKTQGYVKDVREQ